jgi:hypothetical protein
MNTLSTPRPALSRPKSFQSITGSTALEALSNAVNSSTKKSLNSQAYLSYVESVNLLARGVKFILHAFAAGEEEDKNNAAHTDISTPITSHPIILFYQSPYEIEKNRKEVLLEEYSELSLEQTKGILLWNYCAEMEDRTTVSPHHSLPIACVTDVFIGKQAPVFNSLPNIPLHNCFSIIGSKALLTNAPDDLTSEKLSSTFVELDLEAANPEQATNFLLALNNMLNYSGTHVQFDNPKETNNFIIDSTEDNSYTNTTNNHSDEENEEICNKVRTQINIINPDDNNLITNSSPISHSRNLSNDRNGGNATADQSNRHSNHSPTHHAHTFITHNTAPEDPAADEPNEESSSELLVSQPSQFLFSSSSSINLLDLSQPALLDLALSQEEQLHSLASQLNQANEELHIKQQVNSRLVAKLIRLESQLHAMNLTAANPSLITNIKRTPRDTRRK